MLALSRYIFGYRIPAATLPVTAIALGAAWLLSRRFGRWSGLARIPSLFLLLAIAFFFAVTLAPREVSLFRESLDTSRSCRLDLPAFDLRELSAINNVYSTR